MKLKAKIVPGVGCAILTIALQKQYIPLLKDCANGTINCQVDRPIIFKQFDYITRPIEWDTYQNNPRRVEEKIPPEVFKFIKCVIVVNKEMYDGYIYVAQFSCHRKDKQSVELVAPYIDLQDTQNLLIIVDDGKIEYQKRPFSLMNFFKRNG